MLEPAVGGWKHTHSRLRRFPAVATFTYPAFATFTDPAVGEHSIPTDPAVTDPAVGTPGISPASPAPAVGGAGGRLGGR